MLSRQLRLVFAELGLPFHCSSFPIPRVHKAFDEDGRLVDEAYEKRVSKFLAEFEWYIEALKNQRAKKNCLLGRYRLIELSNRIAQLS